VLDDWSVFYNKIENYKEKWREKSDLTDISDMSLSNGCGLQRTSRRHFEYSVAEEKGR